MKKIALFVMVCLMATTAFGQEKKCEKQVSCGAQEWVNKKREQRRAYIIGKMDLNEAEKAAFIAIYDTYNKKISDSKRVVSKHMKLLNDSLTDEEYEKNMDIVISQKLEQAQIADEFYKAMRKALPIKKVYLYYKADKEFNKLMMRDMHPQKKKNQK